MFHKLIHYLWTGSRCRLTRRRPSWLPRPRSPKAPGRPFQSWCPWYVESLLRRGITDTLRAQGHFSSAWFLVTCGLKCCDMVEKRKNCMFPCFGSRRLRAHRPAFSYCQVRRSKTNEILHTLLNSTDIELQKEHLLSCSAAGLFFLTDFIGEWEITPLGSVLSRVTVRLYITQIIDSHYLHHVIFSSLRVENSVEFVTSVEFTVV